MSTSDALWFGLPEDLVRYLAGMICSIPLSVPLVHLPSTIGKCVYSILVAIIVLCFSLGPTSWMPSFFTAACCYMLMTFLPRSISHVAVFIVRFLSSLLQDLQVLTRTYSRCASQSCLTCTYVVRFSGTFVTSGFTCTSGIFTGCTWIGWAGPLTRVACR